VESLLLLVANGGVRSLTHDVPEGVDKESGRLPKHLPTLILLAGFAAIGTTIAGWDSRYGSSVYLLAGAVECVISGVLALFVLRSLTLPSNSLSIFATFPKGIYALVVLQLICLIAALVSHISGILFISLLLILLGSIVTVRFAGLVEPLARSRRNEPPFRSRH